MSNNIQQRAVSNVIWRFLERCGAQLVTLLVTIVLARLLDPSVYGEVAIVTVFITILQVFVDGGLGTALIQKKDADELDFSSVFYFNLLACTVLYALLFILTPLITNFFEMQHLTSVVRVCGIVVLISGVKNVQQAYISKHLLFKKFFFATLGGTTLAAAVGIYMAVKDFGIWALVCQNLTNQVVDTFILWITVRWRPGKKFSFVRLKKLISYGWKLLASALLGTIYNELRQLIIGKRYSTSDLAFYNQGYRIPSFIISNVNSSIDSVLLPTLADEQNDKVRVKAMVRRAIVTSTYIMMPLLFGLSACAVPLVYLVLGEKWLPCVVYIRIFSISLCFYVVHTANLNAIKALGRSDIFLRLEIVKKVVGFAILFTSMWFGVLAMALSGLLECLLAQIINSWPNKKLLNYSYLEQVKDMLPQLLLSAGMAILVYPISLLDIPYALMLIIQIPLGALFYFLCSKLFHLESYAYIMGIINGYRGQYRNKRN